MDDLAGAQVNDRLAVENRAVVRERFLDAT
jgi:hypothetical protein